MRNIFNYIIGCMAVLVLAALFFYGCGANRSRAHKGRPHTDYAVWGLDVSKHNGNINWETVQKSNCPHFVFLKATEGTLICDPKYDAYAKKLDKLGIPRGAYHFFGHRTSGKEQAQNFIKTAKLGKGNLYPVLDIEKHRFMTDPKKMVREAKAFCKEIKKEYGVEPIIYCSTLFYEHYLAKDFKQKDYTLWIADYRGDNPCHISWCFWQHTESHKLRGINANVDRNVFHGSAEDLQKYILR